jgi:ribosomal protein S27AE
MPANKKIICPDCGVEMNQHAEKVNYATALAGRDAVEPDLGGLIKEVHTCPQCGQTLMQRANEAATQE